MAKTKRKKLHGLASKKYRLIVSKAYAELPKLHQAPRVNFFSVKNVLQSFFFFLDWGWGELLLNFSGGSRILKRGVGGGDIK